MIKNNSSINFTSRDIFCKPAPKEPEIKEEPKAEEVQNAEEDEAEYSFESRAKAMQKADRARARNMLMGALMGLSMLSVPFALASYDEHDFYPSVHTINYVQEPTDQEKATIEFAKVIIFIVDISL